MLVVNSGVPGWRALLADIPDDQQRALATRFYRYLSDEEFSGRDIPTMISDVERMKDWAAIRTPGQALVRGWTPDIPGVDHAVIEIVTDDMPFLVDSVTANLVQSGRNVHLLVHPQLAVRRDEDGKLLDILNIDIDEVPPDTLIESWMRIEVERDFVSDDLQPVVSAIRRVLSDVRKAVADWHPMRQQAERIARELTHHPPAGIDSHEVDEARALLEWLAKNNLTFLGYREYELIKVDGEDALRPIPDSGLGILRQEQGDDDAVSLSFALLPAAVRAKARESQLLILSKANSRSTVHRSAYMDYIGIKKFDASGSVIGERRFLGLYAASAYTHSVTDVPVLRDKLDFVMRTLDYVPGSHSAKDLLQFLETYPRDELFQIHPEQLARIAESVLHLQERRQTKLYVRSDDYGRFMSCLVYLPRDRYTTAVRLKIESILCEAFGGTSVDFTARVTESVLARLHYVVYLPTGRELPLYDHSDLDARVVSATQSWADEYARLLVERVGDREAPGLLKIYDGAFPEAFKEDFDPGVGVTDTLLIENLEPGEVSARLYASVVSDAREMRFKVMRVGQAMPLTKVLPILQSLGLDVMDEHPYQLRRKDRASAWVLDFGVILPKGTIPDYVSLPERFAKAFIACWETRAATDSFNTLVVTAGMQWRDAMILRAYARYMRQIESTFGQEYIEQVVLDHAEISRLLIDLFDARFNPEFPHDRDAADERFRERIEQALERVTSLDADRILRQFADLIHATMRTNFFVSSSSGDERCAVAFKLEPRLVPDMPVPVPRFEIWSYSPQVEGVHLRFGLVARGGLRWSDRREDFRTEILGLVKAQEVKNAVIVPVGAKGGFFAKQLPDPSEDREAWLTEGRAAYREFVSSLLEVTDNLIDGAIVPPLRVVRHDGDDPYLVVAADKGTASFSDLANEIASEHRFWLGDAFASGGSVGYDHKAMGITAKGAWESVKRHFRELGIDTQSQDFTVIGIGDMSGDVFGNGMLLSEHIRLIAAFDHRHVFVDPNPEPRSSFEERKRLFDMPRSSWADYNGDLISAGGGVWNRALKAIPISPQMKDALRIPETTDSLTPADLIHAILQAPADLLWNGGIGTYVKSQTQTNADVGDKANDLVRVNGNALKVKVVGEGGNLGLTQLGRVEAARHGVKLNTDAIDNSAGVDTSDHEVNIKIALEGAVKSGKLTHESRQLLLRDMTEEIAQAVLQDNYDQNVVLGNARRGAPALVTVHQRMIRHLEHQGILDRAVENLPDDEEFATRRAAGEALTSPELAVLLAYGKIALLAELNEVTLADDPWFEKTLIDYFPPKMREEYKSDITSHPLRSQIINTEITNRLLNIGGVTFVFRAQEETGASAVQVVKAALTAMEVFSIDQMWEWVNELDNQIPTTAQSALQLETRRLLDRATRWFLQTRTGDIDIAEQVTYFAPVVSQHSSGVAQMLTGNEAERFDRLTKRFVEAGAPEDLARKAASGLDVFALLDIADICSKTGEESTTVIPLYFTLSDRYDMDRTLLRITALPRGDRWTALARQALRSDLYQAIAALTSTVIESTDASTPAQRRIQQWEEANAEGVARARATLDEINAVDEPDLATLSVALRVLRNLLP
jgi:glutamate dehydrogenase